MKKQSNLSRLLQIAGNHKYLIYASWALSAISAFIALVPFYYIWKVIQEVLEVAPDFQSGAKSDPQWLDGSAFFRHCCAYLHCRADVFP